MTTSFVNIDLQRTCILSHAFQTTHWRCVSKVIFTRRTCTCSRNLLDAKCRAAYWWPTLGVTLLELCRAFYWWPALGIYTLQRKKNLATAARTKIKSLGISTWAPYLLSKHSSAAKGIFWYSNHQFIMTVAPQARHKKHAPAGPGTTQVTATQWLIFPRFKIQFSKLKFNFLRDV